MEKLNWVIVANVNKLMECHKITTISMIVKTKAQGCFLWTKRAGGDHRKFSYIRTRLKYKMFQFGTVLRRGKPQHECRSLWWSHCFIHSLSYPSCLLWTWRTPQVLGRARLWRRAGVLTLLTSCTNVRIIFLKNPGKWREWNWLTAPTRQFRLFGFIQSFAFLC